MRSASSSRAARARLALLGLALGLVLALAACDARPADPRLEREVRALAREWRVQLEEGRPADVAASARARLDEAAVASDGECLALAARAFAESGSAEDARALLEDARAGSRANAWIALARGRLALASDEPERALELVDALEEAEAEDLAELARLRGLALVRLGRPQEAERALEEYVARAPLAEGAPEAWHALAELARARGDAERAGARQAQAEGVGRWRAYLVLRRRQAREHPEDPRPALALARLWLEAERAEEARGVLDLLLERHPTLADAHAMRGDALRRLGELEGALAAWTRALELDPSLSLARFNRAHALALAGRLEEAASELEQVVESPEGEDPRLLPAHRELVLLLERLGREDEARERERRLRELEPASPEPEPASPGPEPAKVEPEPR